jgi:DNA polymerase-3 subunit gamma/tau
VLKAIAALDEHAPDYQLVLDDLASALQRIAVAQAAPQSATEFDEAETIKALATRLDPGDVQLYYQVALLGKRDLGLAPSPRAGFEMVLLRMLAFQPMEAAPQGTSAQPAAGGRGPQAIPDTPSRSAIQPSAQPSRVATGTSAGTPASPSPAAWQDPDWPRLIETLELRGAALQLAAQCAYRKREGCTLHLEISAVHQNMATGQLLGRLEEALSKRFGENLKLRVQVGDGPLETPAKLDEKREAERLAAARSAIASDPNVRELCETFGTQVNPELVKPAD